MEELKFKSRTDGTGCFLTAWNFVLVLCAKLCNISDLFSNFQILTFIRSLLLVQEFATFLTFAKHYERASVIINNISDHQSRTNLSFESMFFRRRFDNDEFEGSHLVSSIV